MGEQSSVLSNISAGLPIVGDVINAVSQSAMNTATRKWNERMYSRQREDALMDWARVNEYNHPKQQMERLKAAGLNPNLVYGQGTSTLSAAVRPTDVKSWDPKAPAFDLGQVVNQYLGSQQRTQSMELTEEEIEGKRLDNVYKDLNNLKLAEAMPFNKEIIALKIDQLNEDILGKRAATALAYGENERKWQMHDILKKPTYELKLAEIAQINSNLETNELNRKNMRLMADKLKAETNLLGLNAYQQEILNTYLKTEKKLEQIMAGEKIETERFERVMRVANFTSDQINKILNLTIPKKYKAINTNFNKITQPKTK